MISPWTIYKQAKDHSEKNPKKQLVQKNYKSLKSRLFQNPQHLIREYNKRQDFSLDKQLSQPQLQIQNNSSSFLSHLYPKNKCYQNSSFSINDQISTKKSQLLKNIDSLSFLKSVTASLQKDCSEDIKQNKESNSKFRPIRKFSFQNNFQDNAQKKLIQKLFNLQKSSVRLNNLSEEFLTNELQTVNSQLLAQKFIYKGQKLSLQKKYKSKQQKMQKQQGKNHKQKNRENKFFNATGQSKNIKNLISQILQKHINFNKQPKSDVYKNKIVQKLTKGIDSSINELSQANVMVNERLKKIKLKILNQNKNIQNGEVCDDRGENSKSSFKSTKQLINLKQVCLLKKNRKTLSYADQKMAKNILKYSQVKSEQKITKIENQKNKKIKLKLKKLSPQNLFFQKILSIHKNPEQYQSPSFYLNQMNKSQFKFGDQKIFSKIKYTISHQNSKSLLEK